MRVRFLTLAQREVDNAVRWYEQQAQDLGPDILDEPDRAVRLVRIYPHLPTEIESEIRR